MSSKLGEVDGAWLPRHQGFEELGMFEAGTGGGKVVSKFLSAGR